VGLSLHSVNRRAAGAAPAGLYREASVCRERRIRAQGAPPGRHRAGRHPAGGSEPLLAPGPLARVL